jgi:DNA-binding Xre family transcriptional regulator
MSKESPSESARILAALKRVMKSRSLTYAALATRIGLSEPSVKRIFSRGALTLRRLEEICRALEVSIQEVARLAGDASADAAEQLSLEQENALAADPNLFACFYLLVNGRNGQEIAVELAADPRQVRRWMVQLHGLRLVELRPQLRVRIRTSSSIIWRKDGPVRRLYEDQVRNEFMQSPFAAADEMLHFRSAELSPESRRVLLRKIERLSTEFRDLAELDRSLPAREKRSTALLVGARPWVFSMFDSMLRPSRNP